MKNAEEIIQKVRGNASEMDVTIELSVNRGVSANTRGFCHPLSIEGECSQKQQNITVATENNLQTSAKHDKIFVNDRLKLYVSSTRSGYLTLLNIGSSGKIQILVPSETDATAQLVRAGEKMLVNNAEWIEGGPPTAKHGFPERFLAMITSEPIDFDLGIAGANLHAERIGTRGGFSSVEEKRCFPWDLPSGSWGYGLIEVPVVG